MRRWVLPLIRTQDGWVMFVEHKNLVISYTPCFSIQSIVQLALNKAFLTLLLRLVVKHSRSPCSNTFWFYIVVRIMSAIAFLVSHHWTTSGFLAIIFFRDFIPFTILLRIELALLHQFHITMRPMFLHRRFRVAQLLPARLLLRRKFMIRFSFIEVESNSFSNVDFGSRTVARMDTCSCWYS
jgi:hypothetical protein